LKALRIVQRSFFFLQITAEYGPYVSESNVALLVDALKANKNIKLLALVCKIKIDANNLARLIQAVPGNINELHLSEIDLDEAGLSKIYNSLKDKHINIFNLEYYEKERTLDSYESFLKILQNNFSGHDLKLRGLNIPPRVIPQLANILKDKKELVTLEISQNSIGIDIFELIRHTRARRYHIQNCQLQGYEVGDLVREVIAQNPHIHQLYLGEVADQAASASLSPFRLADLSKTRLVLFELNSKLKELSPSYNFSQEQKLNATLETDFLNNQSEASTLLGTEYKPALMRVLPQLTAAFEQLQRNHHKNLDLLADDYYKFMFRYHLFKDDLEQAVSSLVHIQDKTERIKGLLDDLFPNLMCSVSAPMTAVEKRQWQFVLLCTLECPDPGFISIKANALSVLLTGKNALVDNASDYCATILKDKNAQQVMMEVGSLRQACLAREQTVIENVDHLSVDAFWQERCAHPEELIQTLTQRVGDLDRKVSQLDDLKREFEWLSGMLAQKGLIPKKNETPPAPKEPTPPDDSSSNSKLGMFRK